MIADLATYSDRCSRGFHLTAQHPALCDCQGEWGIFISALSEAARRGPDGLVHQRDVRPLIRGRIEPKHIGQLYKRAKAEGVLAFVRKEPSDDSLGRNTHHDSPVYELRSAA